MAIKLADVLSNVNSAYPVVNAYEQTIMGFYNGASSDASTSIELYYDSTEKKFLSRDGTAGNLLFATRLPYSTYSATGVVPSGLENKLLTDVGGIITVKDEKLNNGGGGVSAYLAQVVFAGSSVDNGRTSMGRWTELVQDFDMYESIDSTGLTNILNTDGENFYLAGFDTENNKTRKIAWIDVITSIGATLVQELVSIGFITNTQAGDNGTGTVGDLNGDGVVSTADLLVMLSGYGGGLSEAFNTSRKLMSNPNETSGSFEVTSTADTASGTGGTFLLSDLTTFDYPGSYTLEGSFYGFDSETYSTNGANVYKLEQCAINDNNTLVWGDRYLYVTMSTYVNFPAADTVWALMHVKIIDNSANSNTLECVYYMKGPGFSAEGGVYANTGSGGFPIGDDVPCTWSGSTNPAAVSNGDVFVADNYQNHADSLAGGFSMAYDGAGFEDYIEDIEVRIFFHSLNGNVSVTVRDVRFEVKN